MKTVTDKIEYFPTICMQKKTVHQNSMLEFIRLEKQQNNVMRLSTFSSEILKCTFD